MLAERRTRTVHHEEWTLKIPAHHTDVAAAMNISFRVRNDMAEDPTARLTTDISVRSEGDEKLIIGFAWEEN